MSIGEALPANTELLIRNMNQAIAHRGPDDDGIFVDLEGGIAMGHRRLSIIDLSAEGHQPMKDDQNNMIVFNGEIYNYAEIKKQQFPNRKFHSSSDTEILMALYAERGHKALNELNGMFSVAFYKQQNRELFIAIDRAGKKPFYYSTTNGIFAFSSEIKALLTLPWIKAETDKNALYNFLTFNQLDAPQTMFRNIFKMAPAECMTVSVNGIHDKKIWWHVDYKDLSSQTESQLADKVYDELNNSVKYRMVADVPVGAFLSGGVDSSAVVALMRNYSDSPIKTYSVGFEGQPDYDERIYAQQISKMFKTEHFEKIVGPDDIAEFLPKIVDIFDEPMADATCIPIYFISKLARENGTIVVQTGDGADELFAGYRGWKKFYRLYPWYHRFTAMPSFVRNSVAAIAGNFYGEDTPAGEVIKRGVHKEEFFSGGAKAFKEHTKRNFLSPDWMQQIDNPDSYEVIKKYRSEFSKAQKKHPWLNDVDWMCYLGFKFLIPAKYLYRMDRLGMANSIEVRNPFLDYHLINTALSVPSAYKIKNGEPKYILKKSLERILPNEILYRKKMGFCVPLREWSGQVMLQFVEDNMKEFCSNTGIFREEGLRKHVQEIRNGNTNYTNNLWTVYFLMAWFKRWM